MHTKVGREAERSRGGVDEHLWVGAALIGMGHGDTRRAEHAARTGRHVIPSATRIEVLEVYCSRCRVPYGQGVLGAPCTGAVPRTLINTLPRA
ncbi:MAG: hypothetical protein ACRDO8_02405 [Nocardioidaceae bacterium]